VAQHRRDARACKHPHPRQLAEAIVSVQAATTGIFAAICAEIFCTSRAAAGSPATSSSGDTARDTPNGRLMCRRFDAAQAQHLVGLEPLPGR
jgi:hypothetical protein